MPTWKIISGLTALIFAPPFLFVGMGDEPFTILLYLDMIETWLATCVFAAVIYYGIIRPRLND